MSDIIIPTIEHATVTLNERNRLVVQMDDGWVFWDTRPYADLTDDEGNPREPLPEEISYFRYGVYSPSTDIANCLIVVAESDVPANQIFGVGDNNHETI